MCTNSFLFNQCERTILTQHTKLLDSKGSLLLFNKCCPDSVDDVNAFVLARASVQYREQQSCKVELNAGETRYN